MEKRTDSSFEMEIELPPSLRIIFNEQGREIWAEVTLKSAGDQLELIIEDQLVYAPQIMGQIPNGVSILGRKEYSLKKIKSLKKLLEK